jgi:hypothetical protein
MSSNWFLHLKEDDNTRLIINRDNWLCDLPVQLRVNTFGARILYREEFDLVVQSLYSVYIGGHVSFGEPVAVDIGKENNSTLPNSDFDNTRYYRRCPHFVDIIESCVNTTIKQIIETFGIDGGPDNYIYIDEVITLHMFTCSGYGTINLPDNYYGSGESVPFND